MKLDNVEEVIKLEFDIGERKLSVFHQKDIQPIKNAISELNLGDKIIETYEVEHVEIAEDSSQKKILWSVLIINFIFFLIEVATGLISDSMGLVADSLDMLADSFVYGMSLLAVGSTIVRKKLTAKIAGYLQIFLAAVGFIEVLRRFLGESNLPDFWTMIVVSLFALFANAVCLYLLQSAKDNKQAHIRASLIFTSNDIIINIGVILAAVLVSVLNSALPDLAVGVIVFVLVMQGAFRILKIAK